MVEVIVDLGSAEGPRAAETSLHVARFLGAGREH